MKRVCLAIGLLLVAHAVFAQTPTLVLQKTIEFDVDATNYSAKLSDGFTAVVQAVQFDAVGMNGNGALALSVVLPSKPTADANGHVGPVTLPQLANLTVDKAYTATVTLIGPNGNATSPASAPFVLATTVPPKPASRLVIK